jgi:hypothetical protein
MIVGIGARPTGAIYTIAAGLQRGVTPASLQHSAAHWGSCRT